MFRSRFLSVYLFLSLSPSLFFPLSLSLSLTDIPAYASYYVQCTVTVQSLKVVSTLDPTTAYYADAAYHPSLLFSNFASCFLSETPRFASFTRKRILLHGNRQKYENEPTTVEELWREEASRLTFSSNSQRWNSWRTRRKRVLCGRGDNR